jgi:two-component system sensor histidine kinase/response regulator
VPGDQESDGRGARVLLAMRDAADRTVAVAVLRACGCDFDEAPTPGRATEAIRFDTPDLILVELPTAASAGPATVRAIRQLAQARSVPIIAVTTQRSPDERAACVAAGVNDFLARPLDAAAVAAALTRWLPTRLATLAPKPPTPVPTIWVDVPGLDAAAGLKFFAGHVRIYELAVRQFVDLYQTIPGPFDSQKASFGAAGRKKLRAELHSFGGAAAVIGALPLHAQAEAFGERLRRRGGADRELRDGLAVLELALGSLLTELSERLAGKTAGKTAAEPQQRPAD